MPRLNPSPISPHKVRVGDHIFYEERMGDMWLSRRGIVHRIVDNKQGQTIYSTKGQRVLFVFELTNKFPGQVFILESNGTGELQDYLDIELE